MPLADNDVTRMTRCQLAERISQMEATAHRNSTTGALNNRHRPMEDRRRWEKIALYKEELERRERNDARQAELDRAENARLTAEAERSKQQSARATKRRTCAHDTCTYFAAQPSAYCAQHSTFGGVPHAPRVKLAADLNQHHEPAPESEPQPTGAAAAASERNDAAMYTTERYEDSQQADDARQERLNREEMREDRNYTREISGDERRAANGLPTAGPVILLPDSRLAVTCPQCHASPQKRCTNYAGSNCAPHRQRLEACRAAGIESHPAKPNRQDAINAKIIAEMATTPRPKPTPAPIAAAIAPDPAAKPDPDPDVAREKAARAASSDPDARRPGHSRKRYPSGKAEADTEREEQNRMVRLLIAQAQPSWKNSKIDSRLTDAIAGLLSGGAYTLGDVLDAAWEVEKALFTERNGRQEKRAQA